MLFLDRDGTLMEDVGYPKDPAAVRLLPGAADAVRELVCLGYVPAVISNQSGIARGLVTQEQADAVHRRFVELFEEASGVRLPAYYCPHGPDDGCDCRKPKTALLRRAAADLGMVGKPGVMVGDKTSDVEAACAAGYDGLLLDDWSDIVRRLRDRLTHWRGETA
jgi:histidinol-phosphate phosphatase family protein